jgi:outer membrane scaffolding protein for murein synthesis (MipA/OmpV family)
VPSVSRSLLLLGSLLAAAPALAQEAGALPVPPVDPARLDGDSYQIGAGVGALPSYEGSDDTVITIVPGMRGRVSGINFVLRGNRFSADLVPTGGGPGWDIQAGPVVSLNLNRTARITDPQVDRLPHRKAALEAGGYVGIGKQGVFTSDYDKLSASIAYVHDVGGVHKSYVITPSIDYGTPLSTKAYVGISVSADYAGGGYADTYFSIDAPGAAASGLPVFAAGKGWKNWTVGGLGIVSLTGDLTHGLALVGGATYRRMLEDFAASPVTSIAGSRDQWTGVLGLAYGF